MEIKIETFGETSGNYMRTALNVRFEIYTKELNIDKFNEFDGLDKESTHYLLFYDMVAAGVCRWRKVEDYIYIDRFGIKKEFREKGLAVLLLKYVVNELIPSKREIQILSIKNSIPFFNLNGFNKIIEEIDLSGTELVKILFEKIRKQNG